MQLRHPHFLESAWSWRPSFEGSHVDRNRGIKARTLYRLPHLDRGSIWCLCGWSALHTTLEPAGYQFISIFWKNWSGGLFVGYYLWRIISLKHAVSKIAKSGGNMIYDYNASIVKTTRKTRKVASPWLWFNVRHLQGTQFVVAQTRSKSLDILFGKPRKSR